MKILFLKYDIYSFFGWGERNILASFFLPTAFFLKVFSGSSEAEEENDPDGPFAFRRKAGCQYYAVSLELLQYYIVTLILIKLLL